jgi:acyl-coenzyme A synthetase/AMP-(fatty) acid ligase
VPREVRIVDAFPMTVTDKAQKFEMRRLLVGEQPTVGAPPPG